VDNNWQNLVDELIYHLQQQPEPVWGVGHSLGGMLHLHAAMRCPQLYRGVVMLDSPVLTRPTSWVIRAAKRFGLIDRLTPAGRTLGRREEFSDLEAARQYFSGKHCFAALTRTASRPICNMVCTRSAIACACGSTRPRKSAFIGACHTPAPARPAN
jgi:pimeloyl-ACP methyl ester carboxylesterase